MNNHTVAQYITRLPELKVPSLKILQMTVEFTQREYNETRANTAAAWKLYDQAIEDQDKEAIADCYQLALMCEEHQHIAWHDLDEAKTRLLAHYQ